MSDQLLLTLQAELACPILETQPLGGGDVSAAWRLATAKGNFFLKTNALPHAVPMFEAEAKGLRLLAATGLLKIPGVIGQGSAAGTAYLLLEHIETGYRPQGFWEQFGAALAQLHRLSAPSFGLEHDNFIGSLPQSNCTSDTWPEFYVTQRLQPQLELALRPGLLSKADASNFERFFKKIPDLCPAEPSALTHGDLWSGNFLVSVEGQPVLIDPALSYAHREMDLAMSRLFGGFERAFYGAYEEAFPLAPGLEQRLGVFQLYYLMVHVNLFGGGYVHSLRETLKKLV